MSEPESEPPEPETPVRRYQLIDRQVVACADAGEWTRWFESFALDMRAQVSTLEVQTSFIGVARATATQLFVTRITGAEHGLLAEVYSDTLDEAETAFAKAVDMVTRAAAEAAAEVALQDKPPALPIEPSLQARIDRVRLVGTINPIAMAERAAQLSTPRGKRMHAEQIARQTIAVPASGRPLGATYTVETGHADGATKRHLRLAVRQYEALPSPDEMRAMIIAFAFEPSVAVSVSLPQRDAYGGSIVDIVQPMTA